jgi:hypothetical protein
MATRKKATGKRAVRRQAPAPDLVRTISADELCGLTGLTDRRHRQLAKDGWWPAKEPGGWRRDETLAGVIKYFREQLHRRDDSLKQEQRKLAIARREKTQEETAVLRNQYVKRAEIGPALRNLSLHQRSTLQFQLENVLAPKLAGKTTVEILAECRSAVDQVCRVFQEGTRGWLEGEGTKGTEGTKETVLPPCQDSPPPPENAPTATQGVKKRGELAQKGNLAKKAKTAIPLTPALLPGKRGNRRQPDSATGK